VSSESSGHERAGDSFAGKAARRGAASATASRRYAAYALIALGALGVVASAVSGGGFMGMRAELGDFHFDWALPPDEAAGDTVSTVTTVTKQIVAMSSTKSLGALVSGDPFWYFAFGTLAAALAWFVWWRRSAMAYGRVLGVAASLAGAAAVRVAVGRSFVAPASPPDSTWTTTFGGTFWLLVAAGVCLALAFLVAPPPRDPDAIDAAEAARLRRLHRESFRDVAP
jgi:hypothetical protein